MHRQRWQAMEELLDEFAIKPIVAVIPSNEDPGMIFDNPDSEFWQRVQRWQLKGWTIGLHGYSHVMRPTMVRQILPFYDRSEFSGLSYQDQAEKIRKGLAIFRKHDVVPKVFVAPAHCFDRVTVDVIRNESEIRVISDGIALNPFYQRGLYWLPQQLWDFSYKPFGVWTICVHPNTCTEIKANELRNAFTAHKDLFIGFEDVVLTRRYKSMLDWMYSLRFWYLTGKIGKLVFNR
jgi:hypothetical protein